ncbi:MAG: succinate dehydrogenase, cytochrome b556 subunit [Wolbachia endosymbiont of Menacanthus eurysternus]|nr:MAG: succinate dehydrogenase, cytochrome b556 subunit [Wolbachia endosymbiont of Menacanthus eurysternus]
MNFRPLSPHLQIYKLQITSFFSIIHRLTGIILFIILMMLSWYFILHVYFPKLFIIKYLDILLSSNSAVIKFIYVLCISCFLYHFLNGIRYLLWCAGLNLEITKISKSAILLTITLLFSAITFSLILFL